jgi:uncharacterized membrane protein
MAVVLLLITIYILAFTIFTIGRYDRYNATGWDLGIFTQLTWNAAHGQFLQNTIAEQNNMLGIHAPYITIVLAPLFWLWADPRMLLIAQTIILGVGAWPIAMLARRHFSQRWIPPLFALLWLLYPALGWINRWDFHEIAPATTFLAFAFEATDRQNWPQTDLWLVLALLCKEEIGLTVAAFGILMAWRYGRSRRVCAVWVIGGTAWFFIHAFFIFPVLHNATNGLPIHAVRYSWMLSGNPTTMVNFIFGPTLPDRFAFLIKLFAPVAFIALIGPEWLIVALPTFAFSLLSSYPPQYDIFMHYTAPIIPAIFVATIFGSHRLICRRYHIPARIVLGTVLAAVVVMWLIYNPFVYANVQAASSIYGWEPGAHVDALNAAAKLIPPTACVVSGNSIQAHYSVRPETYVLGARGDMDGCAYMVVDMGDQRHNDFTDNEMAACYQLWSGKRSPIFFQDTVVVLKWKTAPTDPNINAAFSAYCSHYADALKNKGKTN